MRLCKRNIYIFLHLDLYFKELYDMNVFIEKTREKVKKDGEKIKKQLPGNPEVLCIKESPRYFGF